jgi:YD repeat-containing protein
VDAQMTTYTYDPVVGITSTTDAKNMTTYYEYDSFQRLMHIRDKDRNIIKSFCYNYAGQTTGCLVAQSLFSNSEQSQVFTKNCGSGYTGSTVTYTVAGGTYGSNISQQDANDQASADVLANGQNYADAHGSCTSIPFQVTNNSGLSGFVVTFTAADNTNNVSYPVPTTGAQNVNIVPGTYTIQIQPIGNYSNHTFTLGSRSPSTAPGFYASGVSITNGSSDLSLTIQ